MICMWHCMPTTSSITMHVDPGLTEVEHCFLRQLHAERPRYPCWAMMAFRDMEIVVWICQSSLWVCKQGRTKMLWAPSNSTIPQMQICWTRATCQHLLSVRQWATSGANSRGLLRLSNRKSGYGNSILMTIWSWLEQPTDLILNIRVPYFIR